MTNTITDPQEQALMQAAMTYARGPMSETAEARKGLYEAVEAYARGVGKSSSPEPARCEPPEADSGFKYHWLKRDSDGEHCLCEWGGAEWYGIGSEEECSVHRMASLGWRYLAPCAPPSPCLPDTRPSDTEVEQTEDEQLPEPVVPVPIDVDAISRQEAWAIISPETGRAIISSIRSSRFACGACWMRDVAGGEEFNRKGYRIQRLSIAVHESAKSEVAEQVHPADTRIQPTDEAILQLARDQGLASTQVYVAGQTCLLDQMCIAFGRDCLAHFSPTQTITPVEPEITDHEIEVLWGEVLAELHCTSPASIVPFARRLLAKHSIQPTPAQWEAIRHLAVTEAPEVFADEASAVLRQQA